MSHFPALRPAFEQLLAAIAPGERIAVVGHARPDGDCIGSQVGLCRVLRARGVDAVCVNADPVPRRLAFLVGDTPFRIGKDFLPDGEKADGWRAIFVDCADHARAGKRLASAFLCPLGCIDHHLSNAKYAEHDVVDSAAAATAEILAGLFLDVGLPIDAISAQALYAGIATDTGQFSFPNTTHRVFELTGELIERGAEPAVASNQLYAQESFAKLELLGRFLASLRRECGGRVCVGVLRRSDFAETGALSEDTEGLVDYARSIEGIEIGVLVEERPEGAKASLRAKDPAMRVDRIAANFGGGGHACAAGLNVGEPVEQLRTQLITAIGAHLGRLDAERR
jgi:phosphoesterase RecJ-like protein